MKEKQFSVVVLAGLLVACSNQEISSGKVPSVVLNAVSQQYPAKDDVEWKRLGQVYEAEMAINDSTERTVRVNEAGKILLQKQEVTIAELPEAIRTAIRTRYPGYTIDDAERVGMDSQVYYQVELEAPGKKDRNLVFSADGREDQNTAFWE